MTQCLLLSFGQICYYICLFIPIAISITLIVWLIRLYTGNNAKPTLTVPVRLIKKKNSLHLQYQLVFLTESDEVLKFVLKSVKAFEWEIYNEGDLGNLTYQGFRFIKFERTHINPPT